MKNNIILFIENYNHNKNKTENYLKNHYIFQLFILLLLIINIFYSYQIKLLKNELNKEHHYINHKDYNLYESYKYPQISLLITSIERWQINDNQIFNLINNLINQTIKDIEILFFLSNSSSNKSNIFNKYSILDNRIKIHYLKNKKILKDNLGLINNIKGKYSIIMKKFIKF